MKKCAPLFLVAVALFLHAAPVGSPVAPALIQEGFLIPCDFWMDARLGYEGDFVGDGRMKQVLYGEGRVDTFQQYTNAVTCTLNLFDRVDVFGVAGSSRVCATWRYSLDQTVTRIQMETLYHFLWGIGAKVLFFEWEKMGLGLGGRYAYCNYHPSWLTSNAVPTNVENARMMWREWQIDASFSYSIDILTPYLGIKYSNAVAKLGTFAVPIASGETGDDHFVNKNPVGIVIGCSISNSKYFMLNIEGRLIDEDAVTISGDLRF